MPVTLPQTVNVPPDDISQYTILISGPKKIGKTSLAAAAGKKPFIIQGEPRNSIALAVRQQDIMSWLDFIEIANLLEKNVGYCDVKIVDDVPSFYNLCSFHVCSKLGIEHPGDLGYGKGWNAVYSEFEKRLKKLQSLSGGTIYTAHTAVKDFENRTGKKFNRLETTMTGQADKLMDALVQIWGVMEYDENNERVLTIRGTDFVKAGCGLKGRFLYPDGEEVTQIPLGKTAEYGWSNIVKAFNNQLERTQQTKTSIKPSGNTPAVVTMMKEGLALGKKPGLKLGGNK